MWSVKSFWRCSLERTKQTSCSTIYVVEAFSWLNPIVRLWQISRNGVSMHRYSNILGFLVLIRSRMLHSSFEHCIWIHQNGSNNRTMKQTEFYAVGYFLCAYAHSWNLGSELVRAYIFTFYQWMSSTKQYRYNALKFSWKVNKCSECISMMDSFAKSLNRLYLMTKQPITKACFHENIIIRLQYSSECSSNGLRRDLLPKIS